MMKLLTDNPIPGADADEFGFRQHAEVLCQAIGETDSFPLTIGVFGPWGSGKSSFLNICRGLLADRGFATVMFNPWKYDKRDKIWHALIQSLLDELIRIGESQPEVSPAHNQIKQAVEMAKKLSAAVAWLLARHLVPIATTGLLNSGDVDSFRQSLGDLSFTEDPTATLGYRHINEFEQDFAEVVQIITDCGRLAVFIDDLDRCRPKQALMALEALRLFTGDAPCVFMIAMDQQALTEAAAAHFDNNRERGLQYLEKLINFPYHLPRVRYESINQAYRAKLGYLSDDNAMWTLIQENFGLNPRRIRRFINAFNLAISTLEHNADPSRVKQLQAAKLLMLRQEHPPFFERLRRDPEVWARLEAEATGAPVSLLPEDQELLSSDPLLRDAIRSVSKRPGFDFPPAPSIDEIGALTDAVVLIPPMAMGEQVP
jgi:predicted KAP-like P-loop ATPase